MTTFENGFYPNAVNKVLAKLGQNRIDYQLRSFEAPAHRARQAADLLGCALGAVVKSLVFQSSENDKMVLVLVSGENRADINKLSQLLGYDVRPANPQEVETLTGYGVGSVPPLGLQGDFPVIIDADLMAHDFVWAAAGSANFLFSINPQDLRNLNQGQVMCIKISEDNSVS